MQLYLSNLVDLALRNPYNMRSENFNILHTLLHIILKKLKLTNLCVVLDNDSADIVANLIDNMSQEPSICFKEYQIRSDGSKIKKKIFNSIESKNSLIHIHKNNTQKCSNNSDSLAERILLLESKVSSMLIDNKNFQKQKKSIDDSKEPTDNECEIIIKKQISDLSDSLKLHSSCLKIVKCEDIPKINSIQNQLADVLRNHEIRQINESTEMKNGFKILQKQILSLNHHMRRLVSNFDIYKNTLRDEVSSQIKNQLQNVIKANQKKGDDLEKLFKNSVIITSSTHKRSLINKNEKRKDELHYICTTLDEVQKQISSQSICMHKFIRELELKIDRCEFEMYSRELNDMIDAVVQLKRDVKICTSSDCYTTSMNCMSTNVNMTTASKSQKFVTLRPLKNISHKKLKWNDSPRCFTPFYKNRFRVKPYQRNL